MFPSLVLTHHGFPGKANIRTENTFPNLPEWVSPRSRLTNNLRDCAKKQLCLPIPYPPSNSLPIAGLSISLAPVHVYQRWPFLYR